MDAMGKGVPEERYYVFSDPELYNTTRPHQGQGMDNNVLQPNFHPIRDGPVKCRTALGGIIKSYYREAA